MRLVVAAKKQQRHKNGRQQSTCMRVSSVEMAEYQTNDKKAWGLVFTFCLTFTYIRGAHAFRTATTCFYKYGVHNLQTPFAYKRFRFFFFCCRSGDISMGHSICPSCIYIYGLGKRGRVAHCFDGSAKGNVRGLPTKTVDRERMHLHRKAVPPFNLGLDNSDERHTVLEGSNQIRAVKGHALVGSDL